MAWTRYSKQELDAAVAEYEQAAASADVVANHLAAQGATDAAEGHRRTAESHREIAAAAREGSDALNQQLHG